MGLYDGFQSNAVNLNPNVALVAGMIYISAADGTLDDNEIAEISRVVPDRQALDSALQYVRRNPYQQYLSEAARLLTPAQKMCLVLNAADMAMSDGHLAAEEQQKLIQMQQYFQIPDAHLQPCIQTLMMKNNLNVFKEPRSNRLDSPRSEHAGDGGLLPLDLAAWPSFDVASPFPPEWQRSWLGQRLRAL